MLRGKPLGVLRLYTADHWEFKMQDLVFVQAVAEIIALVLDNIRVTGGLQELLGRAQEPARRLGVDVTANLALDQPFARPEKGAGCFFERPDGAAVCTSGNPILRF
jgi:hypothetical protein